MKRANTSARHRVIALAAALAATVMAPACAEDNPSDDASRSVRIIEAPTPAPADGPAPPTTAPPSPAVSAPAPSATLRPTEPQPAPAPPAPSAAPPALAEPPSGTAAALPAPAANSPTAAELDVLSKSLKLANPADLTIEILPGPDIARGSRVSFRINTKKPGYLILVDVDPSGKLNQIYPNPMSLTGNGDREGANLIRPGTPVQLPNPSDPYARFEFVASPPLGTAMVVALLSDRPVQMVDLPDVPSAMLGNASGAELLSKVASELRIPNPKGAGALLEPHWSLDARFYAIR
jgi:hypothetical protein